MHLPALREFAYLTAQTASVYRVLMRLFYEAHLLQQHTLPPEEILSRAQETGLRDLTPEGLQLDLEQLVSWGNLGRRRDTSRVDSLAEYARRRNLYYATPRGLAIEGFIEAGLDAAEETVAVGAGIVSSLEMQWGRVLELLRFGQTEELEAAWTGLQRDFTALSGDVRSLALNLERKLSLEDLSDFLEFKDAVRSYVERLAGELAGPGRRLRDAVAGLSEAEAELLLSTLTRSRAGRLTRGAAVLDEEQAARLTGREWAGWRGWLTRPAAQGDGLEYGITALRGAVTRVLAFVDAVHRTRELGLGRAAELAALAVRLDTYSTVGLAREELSRTLGVSAPLHVPGGGSGEPVQNAWAEPTETVLLTPVQLGKQRERFSADVREVSREAKRAARDALKAEQQRQKALLALFDENGELDLSHLHLSDDTLLPDLLGWLSAGLNAAYDEVTQATTSGPAGQQVSVSLSDAPALLTMPDGTLWVQRGAKIALVGS
ncbi:DUF2397 domain-containing protein [Deinococcus sp.]|uniref:DUF2397 domain-containing protein n=1 Tax=Deinococcus sp. TaxID=47478 RepID=UPI0025BE23B9|nr:DUF2397 domain-containing protein [Deinococcus sp.]